MIFIINQYKTITVKNIHKWKEFMHRMWGLAAVLLNNTLGAVIQYTQAPINQVQFCNIMQNYVLTSFKLFRK